MLEVGEEVFVRKDELAFWLRMNDEKKFWEIVPKEPVEVRSDSAAFFHSRDIVAENIQDLHS